MSLNETFGAASRSSASLAWNSSRYSSGTRPTSRNDRTWPSFIAAPFIVPSTATICSAASIWRALERGALVLLVARHVRRAGAELAGGLAGGEACRRGSAAAGGRWASDRAHAACGAILETAGMELIHTCYRIGDIDRSVAFYEALGFEELSRMPIRDEAINVFMGLPGDGARLELTYNHGVESYELGTGYNHIAVTVEDLDRKLAALAEAGIEPEKPPYQVREGGSRICFVRDPDGYRDRADRASLGLSAGRLVRAARVQEERLDRHAVRVRVDAADERTHATPGQPLDRLAELRDGRVLEEDPRLAQPLVLAHDREVALGRRERVLQHDDEHVGAGPVRARAGRARGRTGPCRA